MSATVTVTKQEIPQEWWSNLDTKGIEDEQEDDAREAAKITFESCSKGLGIKICGGCTVGGTEDNGIFIKRIFPGGLADIDGRLQQGDQILDVNGVSLEGVTNERAVAILRHASASNQVEMIITRDEQAQLEFCEILEKQNGSSNPVTPIPTECQSKQTSRATTPSGYGTDSMPKSPESNGTEQSNASPRNSQQHSPRGVTEEKVASALNGYPPLRHPHHMMPMASTPRPKSAGDGRPKVSGGFSSLSGVGEPSPVPKHQSLTSEADSVFQSDESNRRQLIDPQVRLKIDELENALGYLGLFPTKEQQARIRNSLSIDPSGTVYYGDFVSVVKKVFEPELNSKLAEGNSNLFTGSRLMDILEPPPYTPDMSQIDVAEDETSLRRERDELRQEVKNLKALLLEKETACCRAEEELLRIKKIAQGETKTLKTKVMLAEQAQRAARNLEQDYEEVVHFLEGEIAKLTAAQKKEGLTENSRSMQQKMMVLACQLKKAEAGKKAYEVTTEKLLHFAEHVHETMIGQGNSLTTQPQGEAARGNRPPGYLGKHKKLNPKTLASEAKEVVQGVLAIIETEPLPYGWEEAHTSDGVRYYIDHVNGVTTWTHPKSGIQHMSSFQKSKEAQQKEPQRKTSQ